MTGKAGPDAVDRAHDAPVAARSSTPSVETHTSDSLPATPASSAGGRVAAQVRDPERYQVINEHGRGGLGRVYRALDRDLDRDVAIKELISRGPVSEIRFHREALITARLEHPGIVPVYEAGRWPDGTPFYAMKLVAGRPLRDLIDECSTVEQRLRLLHHVVAVADAIAYAHGRKIIHRDLKPANVIVGEFGETVVIDWGLAKDLSSAELDHADDGPLCAAEADLTAAGAVVGTPAYMAPEQRRGEQVDQRADIFAIGMMLWNLCSLDKVVPPSEAQRHRMLRRAGIDHDLVAILDKAIDLDPARRYRDAGELAADLRAFRSGARIAGRSYSLFALLAHWGRRHRMLAIAAIALIAAAVVVYRAVLRSQLAEQLAYISITQAEVEAGRQALLHDELTEAQIHLARAYRRGDHSPSLVFMLERALKSRLAERARFASATGRMWSAVFSPDGSQITTADDAAAQIWDAQTYRLLFKLPHGSEVYLAMYRPDGKGVVTAAGDGVRIWDTASGRLVRKLDHPGDGTPRDAYTLAQTRDGHLVAAMDNAGDAAHVWDAQTGAVLARLPGHGSGYPLLDFSADGRWFATGVGDVVRVYDTATWAPALTLDTSRVYCLSFDPTGPRLATGTANGDVAIWAIPTGARIHHLREIGEPVDALAFAPSGEWVASVSRDGALQLWDARSGKVHSQSNHLRSKMFSVEFNRASTLVAAAGSNGRVVVQDVHGELVTVLEGPRNIVLSASFDPRSQRVVGASWDGSAFLWDATAPYRRWNSPPVDDVCGHIANLEPDGRFVAVGCNGHSSRVWDTAHDRLLAELPEVTAVSGDFASAFAAVSADGGRAAIARGNAVEVYALPGGQRLRTIPHEAAVNTVAFAIAGHDLVTGSVDGAVLLTADGRDPIALPRFRDGVDAAGFLADGRVVAAAGNRLRIHDAAGRAILADLEVSARVGILRPSPDSRRLVTVSRIIDAAAPPVLWDVEHYRLVRPLQGHVGWIQSARFVRGGREILTAAGDGTVRSWDAATATPLHTYRGSSTLLSDATVDPAGSIIVAAGGDGLLRFWDASNERMLWTLPAHQPLAVGVHFEGNDIVTRGIAGDVARWTLRGPDDIAAMVHAVLRDASP